MCVNTEGQSGCVEPIREVLNITKEGEGNVTLLICSLLFEK